MKMMRSSFQSFVIHAVLLLFIETVSSGSDDSGHVHLKIHVPEIIKHQMHTRTVIIRVHKPGTKKNHGRKKEIPKVGHEEHHDWSSWSSHDHREEFDDAKKQEHEHSVDHTVRNLYRIESDTRHQKHASLQKGGQAGSYNRYPGHDSANNHNQVSGRHYSPSEFAGNQYRDDHRKFLPSYGYYRDSYLPQSDSTEHDRFRSSSRNNEAAQAGLVGYSYPPQYAVRENPKETRTNEVEPYYRHGYGKGTISKTNHLYSVQSDKFEDTEHKEEAEEEDEDRSVEEEEDRSEGRTHAGRYLLDDTEYEMNGRREEDDYRDYRRKRHGKYRRTM